MNLSYASIAVSCVTDLLSRLGQLQLHAWIGGFNLATDLYASTAPGVRLLGGDRGDRILWARLRVHRLPDRVVRAGLPFAVTPLGKFWPAPPMAAFACTICACCCLSEATEK